MADNASERFINLQLNVTQNAPYLSKGLEIRPCNWANVYGQGGLTVYCTLGEGAEIIDAKGNVLPSNPYKLTLDKSGNGSFRVAAPTEAKGIARKMPLERLTADVSVRDPNNVQNHAAGQATFVDYLDGGDIIQAYQFTIGAVADGRMPCSVYAVVDRNPPGGNKITVLNVTLDGDYDSSATLVNSPDPKTHDFPLNPDGSVQIDIVDKTAEMVSVRFMVPEAGSPDLPDPFEVQFIAFA